MRPATVSKTGTGATAPVVLDHSVSPFNVGIGVVVGGNTLSLQATFDDPFAAVPATWVDITGMTGIAANAAHTLNTPCRAIRGNITAGSGTSTITALQAGK